MANFKNKMIKYIMQAVLIMMAFLARHKSLIGLNTALLRRHAKQRAVLIKEETNIVQDLGHIWQKAFPSYKQVPITNITEDTVYAEIHTPCPPRGRESCWHAIK